jgi:tRNA A37 threonylcarbamoyladenosine synthetase subunit TsaC/SUA5/YrdC
MVKIDSSSRFSRISSKTILTQTDTTVGFLSQDISLLREIKSRNSAKPFIKVCHNFKSLKNEKVRVPNSKKNLLRRSKKTTFIIKNRAFRVAKYTLHSEVLRKLTWTYSTSANESGKKFHRDFCEEKADIIIEDENGLFEGQASKLYKINNTTIRRLR